MNRFKSKIFLIATIGLASLSLTATAATAPDTGLTSLVPADTLSPPPDTLTAPTLWDLATTGSNYFIIPFTTIGAKGGEVGAGLAIGYRIPGTEVVSPVVRIGYFHGSLYAVSANIQFQPPKTLLGKFPITPFALTGVETCLSGAGGNNGTVGGVLGIGGYFELRNIKSTGVLSKMFLAADFERHTLLPAKLQDQINIGLGLNF